MNLAQIKTSDIPKRKLFQIERAVVREMTDLWFRQGCYFEGNFAENADIAFQGQQIKVTFKLTRGLKQGSSEATVNELMKSLILTMATDPRYRRASGKLRLHHRQHPRCVHFPAQGNR